MRATVMVAVLAITAHLLSPAHAHDAPNSTIELAFEPGAARATVRIPLPELSAALDRPITPDAVAAERSALENYLRDHLELLAGEAIPWGLRIDQLTAARDHDHDLLQADVRFSRPAGPDQPATLVYDAALRETPGHVALVYLADPGGKPRLLGRLQNPVYALEVASPPAQSPALRWRIVRPDPIQWVYLATLLAVIALAMRGYLAWRGRPKRRP